MTGHKYRQSAQGRSNVNERQRRYRERLGDDLRIAARERYSRDAEYRGRRLADKARHRLTEVWHMTKRREGHRRRIAGDQLLMTVRVESDVCGICFEPLMQARFPDPMTTTLGHEPPLSVVVSEGWRIVTERPEHWKCNQAKGSMTDAELRWPVPALTTWARFASPTSLTHTGAA